ncbi:Bor/Iss family lipoprotein [Treponema pedis]|nr:hypothetical protein [Treponema pedis]
MKKNLFLRTTALLMLLIVLTLSVSGCMTNRHTVGKGSQTGGVVTTRQWYALWGLVRLGDKDTKHIAGESTDYNIETYYGVVDWLINFFLGWLSIGSRTVKVIK